MVIIHKEVKRGINHTLIIKEVIKVFEKAKINNGFNKKTTAYDKALESLNVKIDSLSSAFKN
jgi:hypothetical protein